MNLARIQKYKGGLAPPTNPVSAVLDVAIPLAGVIGKQLEEDQSVTPAERAALVKYQQDVKRQKYLKEKEEEDIKNADTTPKVKTAEELAHVKKTAEYYKQPDVVKATNARREQIKKNQKSGGKTFEWLDRAARDLVGLDPLHEHQYADLAKTDLAEDYDPSQDEYVKSLSKDKLYQKRILAQKRSQEARAGKGKPPIIIPMKEFVAEHKKLIPILKKGTKAQQKREALDQERELKQREKK